MIKILFYSNKIWCIIGSDSCSSKKLKQLCKSLILFKFKYIEIKTITLNIMSIYIPLSIFNLHNLISIISKN